MVLLLCSRRTQTLEILSKGLLEKGPEHFGPDFDTALSLPKVTSVYDIKTKAQRAEPKPTANNPLYANFGKRKEGMAFYTSIYIPLLILCLAQTCIGRSQLSLNSSPKSSCSLSHFVHSCKV